MLLVSCSAPSIKLDRRRRTRLSRGVHACRFGEDAAGAADAAQGDSLVDAAHTACDRVGDSSARALRRRTREKCPMMSQHCWLVMP